MVTVDTSPGPDWDGHLLLLYRSELERRAGLAAWVCRGLALGEKVISTEAPGVASEDSVLTILDERGVDVAAATADGRLAVLPLAEFYPSDAQATVIARALAEGFTGVRVTAEASAVLGVLDESAYAAIERSMDKLCRTRTVSVMCQYARHSTSGARLREVVAVHLVGIRETNLRTTQNECGTAFSGEIDISNVATFTAAVEAAVQTAQTAQTAQTDRSAAVGAATGVAWLDLGGVSFVDVGACRALGTATRWFRHGGGLVLVVAPQPTVERILRLLAIDQLPGLEVIGGDP